MPESTGGFAVGPLVRFAALAVGALGEAREEIDALNVYPVPDGDTGTNLFLTFGAAQEALLTSVREQGGEDAAGLGRCVHDYGRGLLLGARGNSGVIMSQLAGAFLTHVSKAPAGDRAAVTVARALAVATQAAYAAVGDPVEGTMLSVARAASEAATALVQDPQARTAQVFAAAARAAHRALAHTPDQLEVLRQAGVVDAGAQGLCLVLDAAESAFTGRRELIRPGDRAGHRTRPIPVPVAVDEEPSEDGPAYEVMFLLDAEEDRVAQLRGTLLSLGDSLVVSGSEGLWNVHVHVDDVGAAIEAGIAAGRPHRVRVTHFAEQASQARRSVDRARGPRAGRRVVVLAAGPGLSRTFQEAGAHVVDLQPWVQPTTEDLVEAVRSTRAAEVVLLPNGRTVVPTATAAAGIVEAEDGVTVAVVPTRTQVQGMAAMAVHEPGRSFDQDLVEMAAAARHARSGAVTVATRRAMTTAGLCEPGDVLGVVEGDFAVVGDDLAAVAVSVAERLLGGGGELVTLVSGAGGAEVAEHCAEHVRQAHPTVDVLVYSGGQDRYPLLLGVE